jgi:hypothetical protein
LGGETLCHHLLLSVGAASAFRRALGQASVSPNP